MPSFRDPITKIDIVDVISSYIELKRVGNNYVARCPFHPDDTPSFFVSPSKGIFKCFGCGVGGDAVKFVSLYENIDYWEALERLAKKYNLAIPTKARKKEKNHQLLRALEMVAEFYHQELRENSQALEYLKARGVNSKTINKFTIGFGGSTERLTRLLREEGLLELYEKSGNLVKVDENTYRDLFRNRLIIPVRDMDGNVIAFGGRSLDGSQPKYINSPESEVFKKRITLFGLYESKEYIKEEGEAIVVEGYFDLISLWQEGIKNCVAPLGTALTEEHAGMLSKLIKRVLLLYDGDKAGRRAVRSSVPNLLMHGLTVRVVYLPEGEDPDSLVRKEPRVLRELLQSAREVEVYLLERIREGDKEAFEDLLYFCGFIPDSLKRYELLRSISQITGLPITNLQDRVKGIEKKPKKEEFNLGYHELVFLAGLYRFGFEGVNLEELRLSPNALEIVEAIKNGEHHLIPDRVKNIKVNNLQRVFQDSLKALKMPSVEELEGFEQLRQKSKAQPRKLRSKH
ncbi:MAG: DNA primase [Aquificaceae bacterium]|nr:DNA primase [Aquificaceae bacterium]MDW8423316.1 DNA primase [Aquificaceae bacterium]